MRVFVGFLHKLQGGLFAAFGFRCFSARLSLSPSSPSPPSLLGAGPGALSSSSVGLHAGRPTSAMWAGGSTMAAHVLFLFFLFLSARVGRRSPSLLPPSVFSLSLSLFSLSLALASMQALQDSVVSAMQGRVSLQTRSVR